MPPHLSQQPAADLVRVPDHLVAGEAGRRQRRGEAPLPRPSAPRDRLSRGGAGGPSPSAGSATAPAGRTPHRAGTSPRTSRRSTPRSRRRRRSAPSPLRRPVPPAVPPSTATAGRPCSGGGPARRSARPRGDTSRSSAPPCAGARPRRRRRRFPASPAAAATAPLQPHPPIAVRFRPGAPRSVASVASAAHAITNAVPGIPPTSVLLPHEGCPSQPGRVEGTSALLRVVRGQESVRPRDPR